MPSEQLLPCPLAHRVEKGIDVRSSSGTQKWHITCFDCGLAFEGHLNENRASVCERWNTRVSVPAVPVVSEEVKRALALCAIPYEALLIDAESRKWIAPEIWKAIEDAVVAIRAVVSLAPKPAAANNEADERICPCGTVMDSAGCPNGHDLAPAEGRLSEE